MDDYEPARWAARQEARAAGGGEAASEPPVARQGAEAGPAADQVPAAVDLAPTAGHPPAADQPAAAQPARADESLDCIGLFCPEPLFQTRQAIDRLSAGQVLEVLADDPAAEEDLTRFAKRAGHEVLLVEDRGDHKRLLLRKGAS